MHERKWCKGEKSNLAEKNSLTTPLLLWYNNRVGALERVPVFYGNGVGKWTIS